jgi:hypothetical protein
MTSPGWLNRHAVTDAIIAASTDTTHLVCSGLRPLVRDESAEVGMFSLRYRNLATTSNETCFPNV